MEGRETTTAAPQGAAESQAAVGSSVLVTSSFEPPERLSSQSAQWQTKQMVLIRHGRSTWNEFLGQHKKGMWQEQERTRTGLRATLRQMVGRADPQQQEKDELLQPVEAKSSESQRHRGFWEGVRGGVKHVANAIGHAGELHQTDHPLSPAGVMQARRLRASIAGLVEASAQQNAPASCSVTDDRGRAASGDPAAVLLECKHWLVSPSLRALETAAYALSPLRRRHPSFDVRLTPEAREIVNSRICYDCEGKQGNLGYRVIARALGRIAKAADNEEADAHIDAITSADRQMELADVSAALCAMDLAEILQVWWTDVSSFKKEHLKEEDQRVRKLVTRLLEHPAPCVGVVAHSILFQRMIQLYWPRDDATQQDVRTALRHKAAPDGKDPCYDKIMNCGTLVLTWRYRATPAGSPLGSPLDAEIRAAKFLFDSCMEDALAGQERTYEVPDGPTSLDDFVHVGVEPAGDGHCDEDDLL